METQDHNQLEHINYNIKFWRNDVSQFLNIKYYFRHTNKNYLIRFVKFLFINFKLFKKKKNNHAFMKIKSM